MAFIFGGMSSPDHNYKIIMVGNCILNIYRTPIAILPKCHPLGFSNVCPEYWKHITRSDFWFCFLKNHHHLSKSVDHDRDWVKIQIPSNSEFLSNDKDVHLYSSVQVHGLQEHDVSNLRKQTLALIKLRKCFLSLLLIL